MKLDPCCQLLLCTAECTKINNTIAVPYKIHTWQTLTRVSSPTNLWWNRWCRLSSGSPSPDYPCALRLLDLVLRHVGQVQYELAHPVIEHYVDVCVVLNDYVVLHLTYVNICQVIIRRLYVSLKDSSKFTEIVVTNITGADGQNFTKTDNV